MPPHGLDLDGETLGKKHRQFNKLVKEAASENKTLLPISADDSDIENLLKIDIACKTKNVEYILDTFKSKDMLYVSRAIKHSTWLITEKEYAHIMNPIYLNEHIFPHMMTSAVNKVMLSIRLNLKDPVRVEKFFHFVKEKNPESALKWLQYCSLEFVKQIIKEQGDDVSTDLLKRLCEANSLSVLEAYKKNVSYFYSHLSITKFLINLQPEQYLDLLSDIEPFRLPRFSAKNTENIMKKCPNKVLENLERYIECLNLKTFANHIKPEEIQSFLVKHAPNSKMSALFNQENITHFFNRMPKKDRFEFIKKIMITKAKDPESAVPFQDDELCFYSAVNNACEDQSNSYRWYLFAPFDVAFKEIKKLIHSESSPSERNSMITVLLKCAGKNLKNIQIVLQYYHDKHINEPFKFKIQFLNIALSNLAAVKNDDCWIIFSRLFHSVEVYVESDNSVQKCLEVILIRNVLKDEIIPDIISKKISFTTMKYYIKKLNSEEQCKIFDYLYNNLKTKLENVQSTDTENNYRERVNLLENVMQLLKDWNKNLRDYPYVTEKINEIIKVRKEKSWVIQLNSLFNVNKSWRIQLFEESIALSASEKTFINALKHDPSLLSRYNSYVQAFMQNNNDVMRQFFNKLRIYWPSNLAAEWKRDLTVRLEDTKGLNATVQRLMPILNQDELLNIIREYAPAEKKINWTEEDQRILTIRKNIAKSMHFCRPLLSVDIVLLYAKGDYLQYTVPSLSSVLQKSSPVDVSIYIKEFLNAPVSLQKIGITYVFNKLPTKELKPVLLDLWKNTKNASIRAVIFKIAFKALCKEKKEEEAEELCEILTLFMENLTSEENKVIYKMLSEVKEVPLCVRAKFYMKSYVVLKSLPPKANADHLLTRTTEYANEIMDLLDSDFVGRVVLQPLSETFKTSACNRLSLFATYLLKCKDESIQQYRFEKYLAPILKQYLPMWNEIHEERRNVRYNIQEILRNIRTNLKHTILNGFAKPTNIITKILNQLENILSKEENYNTLTSWKLTLKLVQAIDVKSSVPRMESKESSQYYEQCDKSWNDIFVQISTHFAKDVSNLLMEDVGKYSPTILLLYVQTFSNFMQEVDQYSNNDLLKCVLESSDSEENFIFVIQSCDSYVYTDKDKKKIADIKSILESHPSPSVKTHFWNKFVE